MPQNDKSALALVRALFVDEDQAARQLLADLFEEEGDDVAAVVLRAQPYVWRLHWGPSPAYADQDNTQVEYHASKALAMREGAKAAREMALDHFELDVDNLDESDPDVVVFKKLAALLEEGRHQEAVELFKDNDYLGDCYVLSLSRWTINCE